MIEFTKQSKNEKRYHRQIWKFRVLIIAYVLVIIALGVFINSYVYFGLILGLNVTVVYYMGVTAVKSLVFPLSTWVINNVVDCQTGTKYANSFVELLEKCYVILRLQMVYNPEDENKDRD